jgi:hypothetical protein
MTQQGPCEFELVGGFGFGEADNLAGASVVAFTERTASDLLMTDDGYLAPNSPGRLQRSTVSHAAAGDVQVWGAASVTGRRPAS